MGTSGAHRPRTVSTHITPGYKKLVLIRVMVATNGVNISPHDQAARERRSSRKREKAFLGNETEKPQGGATSSLQGATVAWRAIAWVTRHISKSHGSTGHSLGVGSRRGGRGRFARGSIAGIQLDDRSHTWMGEEAWLDRGGGEATNREPPHVSPSLTSSTPTPTSTDGLCMRRKKKVAKAPWHLAPSAKRPPRKSSFAGMRPLLVVHLVFKFRDLNISSTRSRPPGHFRFSRLPIVISVCMSCLYPTFLRSTTRTNKPSPHGGLFWQIATCQADTALHS